jgi:hypothetical protein
VSAPTLPASVAARAKRADGAFDVQRRELRAQIAAGHRVARRRGARLAAVDVPHGTCRTDGSAGIAGRRLNPQVVEQPAGEQLAVGDAVERHAAGHHEVAAAGGVARRARQAQDDLLGHQLDGERQVHVRLRELGVRCPSRQAEEARPLVLVHHSQAGGEVEVRHVEQQRPVGPDVHELAPDRVGEAAHLSGAVVAVRRQAHQLVLAAVDREARK